MTQDLLLYDPKFARANDDGRYDRIWTLRYIREVWGHLVAALKPAIEVVCNALRNAFGFFQNLNISLQDAGLLPPDPAAMLCGQRWRSPIDGTKYRVAGQRGNRHWIEAGPRCYRYKR